MDIQLIILVLIGILTLVMTYLVYGRDKTKSKKESEGFDLAIPRIFMPHGFKHESGAVKAEPVKKVKTSPISGTCSACKKKISLPFKCKFCGDLYCSEHRLPESHSCAKL